ncbi:MAG: response regulator [bacterium]
METTPDALRVLIVDDEPSIREGSMRILKRIGLTVETAGNGQEALDRLAEQRAAIVLLDMKMPGMDGMEVLQRIRELDDKILVIVITGYATLETAVEAMKLGAYDFIPKPFEPAALRIVVNRASERIRLVRDAELHAEERRRTLADLDTEKSRIRTILESLPSGTLVTNAKGQVALMNAAFRRHFALPRDRAPGEMIDAYITDAGLCELVLRISRGQVIDFDDVPAYEFQAPNDRYLVARAQPVMGERHECLGAVVSIDDITAMKVFDRLKSEFVAKVSHELRSPLSTIHEQLAVVLGTMGEVAPDGDQRILARAKEKTHGLISLIGDLLDLSRIEEGSLCRDPRPVRLDELLGSIVSFLGAKAKSRQQSLTLELPDAPLPEIEADPLALESIFGNLITNALHYSPESATIRVQVDVTGINARVKVIDDGFGIEARHLEHIFDRFYRVKNEQTRFITGTGLGLPIVKELVSALGGLIEVESEPGKGSTFTVLLPIHQS